VDQCTTWLKRAPRTGPSKKTGGNQKDTGKRDRLRGGKELSERIKKNIMLKNPGQGEFQRRKTIIKKVPREGMGEKDLSEKEGKYI